MNESENWSGLARLDVATLGMPLLQLGATARGLANVIDNAATDPDVPEELVMETLAGVMDQMAKALAEAYSQAKQADNQAAASKLRLAFMSWHVHGPVLAELTGEVEAEYCA